MGQKNMIIALVLSFLFTGIGNVYNGLIKRGILEFVVAVVINMIHYMVTPQLNSPLFIIISFLWWVYALYDTYQCTNAINNG
ncbi:MAG: hypothetical protein J6S29_01955 [Methanosphaera sp.]|nr:hypothetical protein [Methanosphaera sp.]